MKPRGAPGLGRCMFSKPARILEENLAFSPRVSGFAKSDPVVAFGRLRFSKCEPFVTLERLMDSTRRFIVLINQL